MLIAQNEANMELELGWIRTKAMSSYAYSNMAEKRKYVLGAQFDDLVIDCYYRGKTCNRPHFKLYLHPNLINCYTFQANLTTTTGQLLDGPQNGLTLILRSSPSINYYYGYFDVMQNVDSIRLAIYPPGTVPFMRKKALNLESGKSTSISLMMKTHERLGSPYTNCHQKEMFDLDSRLFQTTRDVCAEKCMIEKVQRECNCTPIMLEDLTRFDHQYCSGVENISPSEFEERTRCEIGIVNGKGNIDCNSCVYDCQQVDYEIQTTFSEWPHPSKINQLIEHYVLHKKINLISFRRQCSDPVLSYYALLLKKANISSNICTKVNSRKNSNLPFSMMTILNIVGKHMNSNARFITIVEQLLNHPGFPEMFEYIMDVPASYYDVKTVSELNAKWIKESFYQVNIYFHQTAVEQHVQEPSFSFPDLCSSIGGILGLWAGFSLMTIIEICSYIVTVILRF